jgi:hypothetical protein
MQIPMTIFDTDAHVDESEETFAALQNRPEFAGAAPRVIEGERRAFWGIAGRSFPQLTPKILANGARFFAA